MTEWIALLRGINVGRAKRISMADLRGLVEGLGCSDVRTVLNSGNVLFQSVGFSATELAAAVRRAIAGRCGFDAPVVVVSSEALSKIVEQNPLPNPEADPSRFLVAFVADPAALVKAKPMLSVSWSPEGFALGSQAAYLWCPGGVIESRVAKEFTRLTRDAATARNWATVLKLQAASCKKGHDP
jgi:uncharacterized protein (DUF1697 family)